jgi:hypothetical protein
MLEFPNVLKVVSINIARNEEYNLIAAVASCFGAKIS